MIARIFLVAAGVVCVDTGIYHNFAYGPILLGVFLIACASLRGR